MTLIRNEQKSRADPGFTNLAYLMVTYSTITLLTVSVCSFLSPPMRGVDHLHLQPDLNKFPFKVVKRSPMEGYSWETDLGIGIIYAAKRPIPGGYS